MNNLPKFVVDIKEVDKEDILMVGGKGANLGEMVNAGFPIPKGFIVTSFAYFNFLEENSLSLKIKSLLSNFDRNSTDQLQDVSERVSSLIKRGEFPEHLKKEVIKRYRNLGGIFRKALVAVRSSATAEDLPQASFAGQQASFLNIKGEANLINAIRNCWASLFTPRAIFYREENRIDHFKVGIAIVVQEMIQSEISGVAFTIDPTLSDKRTMVIEAIWGLGEMIVQGEVTPDRYKVDKITLELLEKEIAPQTVEMVKKNGENRKVKIPASRQQKQKLTDQEIKELAEIIRNIHQHYYFPQDIEWAYQKKKFYIIQSRPVTTIEEVRKKVESGYRKEALGKVLLTGIPASPGISTGPVKIIKSIRQLRLIKRGDVLVAEMTSPDFVPAMKKASAIVTDKGGQTSHAAIVSRELGIPCVVGTSNATKLLEDETVVTVDGAKGKVFAGNKTALVEVKKEVLDDEKFLEMHTKTKIYVNLAEPQKAVEISRFPVDGVGLLRAEFMITQIGVHPRQAIKEKKQSQFIDRLALDIQTFCKAFNPRPVVYRATDFKSNEYRNLRGGRFFEPQEANPMLGFRGAFRYIADPQSFELELAAIKKVRENGYKNIWLMIPFVRSYLELQKVKQIITSAGLIRSPSFKIWMMVELPVNVIMLEKFIDVGIDGISIGSNDLTMLMLGTDRDNSDVANAYNERDPSVLWALEKVIKTCRKYGITSSICGQAPSQYEDLVEKLVSWGITSISVNPDAIAHVKHIVYKAEERKAGNV